MLARYGIEGTHLSLLVAAGFAIAGGVLSMLRLSPAGARGATAVKVREGQQMTGE